MTYVKLVLFLSRKNPYGGHFDVIFDKNGAGRVQSGLYTFVNFIKVRIIVNLFILLSETVYNLHSLIKNFPSIFIEKRCK